MELAVKVAGLGFRAAAGLGSLVEALALLERPDALATSHARARLPVIAELARILGLPLIAVDVAGIATPTRSARVLALCATGSVAEAAALAALGPGARITCPRVISPDRMASAALAEGDPA